MKIFELLAKYKDEVTELLKNHIDENTFGVNPEDFDFSYDKITMEADDDDSEEAMLNFTAKIGDIKICTTVDASNLKDCIEELKKIQDSDLREEIVLAIEEKLLSGIAGRIENSEATLEEAKKDHQNCLDEESGVKSSLREIKDEWGII